MKIPTDPFLKDADGAAKFVRDLLRSMWKPKNRDVDWSAATYWAARCAAHWAQKSKAWEALASNEKTA